MAPQGQNTRDLDHYRQSIRDLQRDFARMQDTLRDSEPMRQFIQQQIEAARQISATQQSVKTLSRDVLQDLTRGFRQAVNDGAGFSNVLEKIRNRLEEFVFNLAVVNPLSNQLFNEQKPTIGSLFSSDQNQQSGLFGFLGQIGGLAGTNSTPQHINNAAPTFVTNITAQDAGSFRASQGSILASFYKQLSRAARFI